MDHTAAISISRLLIALVILAAASVSDIKTRRVGNTYWILMAIIGLVLVPVQIAVDGEPWEYAVILVPILVILSDVYLEGRPGSLMEKYGAAMKYGVAVVATIAIGYLWGTAPYFQHLLGIPVMMIVIVALYMLDMVRGGADAKALISLSILFPFYPAFAGVPIIQAKTDLATIVLPFSFTVLVNAAIIVAVVVPLGYLLSNAMTRDLRFPNALLGRRVATDSVKNNHVWLMERIVDGRHVLYTKPKRNEDLVKELGMLKDAGVDRVWVTPKIPFIVPMLAGLVVSAIVGNLLALVFVF